MTLFFIFFIIVTPLISSLFFEYGTQNSTNFRIEDTTGAIVASDRIETSSLRFSGDDLILKLTGQEPFTFYPSDDSFTTNSSEGRTNNYNELSWLESDKTTNLRDGFYIKFSNFSRLSTNLSSLSVQSATLFLSADLGFTTPKANVSVYHVYSNVTWNETNITFNNQPCGSTPIISNNSNCNLTVANTSTFQSGIWNSLDVTNIFNNFIAKNTSNFSVFVITNTTGSIFIHRRENTVLSPYLVIKLTTSAAAFRIKQFNGTDTCILYFNGNFSCSGISTFSSVSGVVKDVGGHDLYGTYRFINASRSPLKIKNLTYDSSDPEGNGFDTSGMFTGNYSSAPSFKMNILGTTHSKGFTRFLQSGTSCSCEDGTSCFSSPGQTCNSPENESVSITFTQCTDPASPLNISEGEYFELAYDRIGGTPQRKRVYFPRLSNITACESGFALYIADDGSTYYDAGLTRLAYSKSFISINGTQVLSGLEFIKPEHISDVDDEDVETDLNTYVDVGGDNMTGPLFVNERINASNVTINSGGNLTMFSADGTRWRCGPSNTGSFSCS